MILSDEQIFILIKQKLETNEPFSLLRYGDGEGLFAFLSQEFGGKYSHAAMKHWGEVPRNIFRMEIARNLKISYRKCDVAGLPYGFEGFLWKYALNSYIKLLAKTLTCNANIHISMYKNGWLADLIYGRPVFYVSCRNVDDMLMELGAKCVDKIIISAQYKFEATKPVVPFYRETKLVEAKIKNKKLKGTLCFLAAGVAGKQLGIAMQKQGGIVVDIGSVFDLLAGVKSRGWMKSYELM